MASTARCDESRSRRSAGSRSGNSTGPSMSAFALPTSTSRHAQGTSWARSAARYRRFATGTQKLAAEPSRMGTSSAVIIPYRLIPAPARVMTEVARWSAALGAPIHAHRDGGGHAGCRPTTHPAHGDVHRLGRVDAAERCRCRARRAGSIPPSAAVHCPPTARVSDFRCVGGSRRICHCIPTRGDALSEGLQTLGFSMSAGKAPALDPRRPEFGQACGNWARSVVAACLASGMRAIGPDMHRDSFSALSRTASVSATPAAPMRLDRDCSARA